MAANAELSSTLESAVQKSQKLIFVISNFTIFKTYSGTSWHGKIYDTFLNSLTAFSFTTLFVFGLLHNIFSSAHCSFQQHSALQLLIPNRPRPIFTPWTRSPGSTQPEAV